MKGKVFLRRILSLMLIAVMYFGILTCGSVNNLVNDVSADSLTDMQNKLEELKKQQKQNQANLTATRNKASEQEEYQKNLMSQINLLDEKISIQEAQINQLSDEISGLENDIDIKNIEIEEGIARFEKRLKTMYISNSRGNLASVLVGAESFYDLLNRVRVVQRISEYDDKMIDELNVQLDDLNNVKAQVEAAKLEQERIKTDLEGDRTEINGLVIQTTDTIAMLEKEASNYASKAAEYEQEQEKIEKEIKAEIKRRADAAKVFVGGTFTWPCPDVHATSDVYGWRTLYGKQNFHKGIDITKPGCGGKDIVASNAGTVIIATNSYTPGYSYGKYVVIDHGGGITTLYGHCNQVLVSVGQVVTKGEVIAKIGTTGDSTGNHCHFEIRVNGEHTDPMKYFTKTSG